mmetsp:Transcript_64740/g.162911  ORF Transcript_64740/g.162911 Transcript_64740/m.162911 type:complete len:1234 (+) Transcript_64740:132-3833(+)
MSSTAAPATQLRLHVQLNAMAPHDGYCLTGSNVALGEWSPAAGVALEWRGNSWVTRQPVTVNPRERIEFKFVKLKSTGVDWEDGPNRVLDVPAGDVDLKLKGRFNADTRLSLATAADLHVEQNQAGHLQSTADLAVLAAWRRRLDETEQQIIAQEEELKAKRKRHALALERRAACVERLRRELADVKREAAERRAAKAEEEMAATAAAAVAAAAAQVAAAAQAGQQSQVSLPLPSPSLSGSAVQRCPSASGVPPPRFSGINISGAGAGLSAHKIGTSTPPHGASTPPRSAAPRPTVPVPQVDLQAAAAAAQEQRAQAGVAVDSAVAHEHLSGIGVGLSPPSIDVIPMPAHGASTPPRSAAPRPTVPMPRLEEQAAELNAKLQKAQEQIVNSIEEMRQAKKESTTSTDHCGVDLRLSASSCYGSSAHMRDVADTSQSAAPVANVPVRKKLEVCRATQYEAEVQQPRFSTDEVAVPVTGGHAHASSSISSKEVAKVGKDVKEEVHLEAGTVDDARQEKANTIVEQESGGQTSREDILPIPTPSHILSAPCGIAGTTDVLPSGKQQHDIQLQPSQLSERPSSSKGSSTLVGTAGAQTSQEQQVSAPLQQSPPSPQPQSDHGNASVVALPEPEARKAVESQPPTLSARSDIVVASVIMPHEDFTVQRKQLRLSEKSPQSDRSRSSASASVSSGGSGPMAPVEGCAKVPSSVRGRRYMRAGSCASPTSPASTQSPATPGAAQSATAVVNAASVPMMPSLVGVSEEVQQTIPEFVAGSDTAVSESDWDDVGESWLRHAMKANLSRRPLSGPLLRPKAPHPTPSAQRLGGDTLASATMLAVTVSSLDGDENAAMVEGSIATVSNTAVAEKSEGIHNLACVNPEFTAAEVDESAVPTVETQRLLGQIAQEGSHEADHKTLAASTTEFAAAPLILQEANANSLASQPSVSPPPELGSGGRISPPNYDSFNDGIGSDDKFSVPQESATKTPGSIGVPPWGSLQLHRKASKRFSPATTAAASSAATSGEATPCVATPTRASSAIFERRSNPVSSGPSDTKQLSPRSSQAGSISSSLAGSRSATAPRKHPDGDWPAFALSSSPGFERSGSGRITATAFPRRGTLGRKTISQKQSTEFPRDDMKRARCDVGPDAIEQASLSDVADDPERAAAAVDAMAISLISVAPMSGEQEHRSDDASHAQAMTQNRGFVASPGVVAALELAKARFEQRRTTRAAIGAKAAEADP